MGGKGGGGRARANKGYTPTGGGSGAPPAAAPAMTMAPGDFADAVLAAAKGSESGWFGDNKLLINHAWDAVKGDPRFSGMSLEDFKARLLAADRAGKLSMARGDLVEAISTGDLRESSTPYLNATYNFLRVDRPRAASPPIAQVRDRIESAYAEVKSPGGRAYVADIRALMEGIPREVQDRAIEELVASGRATLYRADNPADVTPHRKAGMYTTPSGEPREILYVGGRGSRR